MYRICVQTFMWCTGGTLLRGDTGVLETFCHIIYVVLDKKVTTMLYICVLFTNNPISGNLHTLHSVKVFKQFGGIVEKKIIGTR